MRKRKYIFLVSAEMGKGTFEAKFYPLSLNDRVDQIHVLRKSLGPSIDKIQYHIIPRIFRGTALGLVARPILLMYLAIRIKPDIVLGYHVIPHGFFISIVSKFTRIKGIIAQTGLSIQNHISSSFKGKMILSVLKSCSFIFVPGNASYRFWSDNGISTDTLKILHSTIDTDHFKPLNTVKKEFDFIILSRLVHEKRIDIILEIFRKLKTEGYSFRAVIVGDGNKYDELFEYVRINELQDCVEFKGFQDNTKFWFNKARYYLMYSYTEGLPTSLMQAMSCGLVPITTDVGNISDIVSEDNGFIFSFDQQAEYEMRLKELLREFDNADYTRLSHECRKIIEERHSYQSAILKWNEVLNEL